jgi:hypothetical protein
MLTPDRLPALHQALHDAGERVDGWLLFDFRGVNPIFRAVAGAELVGSRRVYLWVPREGTPVALVHAVDAELWREWPAAWRRVVWVRREELARELGALVGGRTIAIEYSPGGDVPYADYVPAGTVDLLRAVGAQLRSSAELVTRYCSVWSDADLASHLRAARVCADIARSALRRAGEAAATAAPLTEHDVVRWVLDAFDRAGLVTESPPSVSYGANAARVHYDAPADGSLPIVPGALLLLDLWAREPGGVYADQTWMGAIGAPSGRADGGRGGRPRGVRCDRASRARRAHRLPHRPLDRPRGAPRLRADDRRHRELRHAPHRPGGGLLRGAGDLLPGRDRRADRGERARPRRRARRHAGRLPARADRGVILRGARRSAKCRRRSRRPQHGEMCVRRGLLRPLLPYRAPPGRFVVR